MSDTNKSEKNAKEKQTFELDLQSLESKPVGSAEPVVKYSNIKRMLGTLDKFLSTKLSLVLGICILTIASCSVGLLINNTSTSSASNGSNSGGNGADLTLNTWLWSILALFVFLAVLSVIYSVVRARAKKRS